MDSPLIITNGDSAVERLRHAGVAGTFLPWRDALHDGPAPAGLFLEALSLVRARYLASEFGQSLSQIVRQMAERDATLRDHGRWSRVELWFEHDLYDQLQLIQLLDFFAGEKRGEGLFLVQARDYLGTLPRSAVRVLAERAAPVRPEQLALAQRAWSAFTASDPESLATLTAELTPGMPFLGQALSRLVQEFPDARSGLGLTEARALAALAQAPKTVAEVFAVTQAQEASRFLSDTAFFRRLDRLAFVAKPLIDGVPFPSTRCAEGTNAPDYRAYAGARVQITDLGRAALEGGFDHAAENGVDRWFGGTHVTAASPWRRDGNRLTRKE